MSYYDDEMHEKIRSAAITHTASEQLWSFIHSTLIDIAEHQGGELVSGADGFFKMKTRGQVGEFDVNTAAEWLEVALIARAEFLRERAENDKSG